MARKPTHEKFKTYQDVFDEQTLRAIFEIGSKGYFQELKSPISIGKESNIFSAVTKDGGYLAVKIYRVNVCDFKKMYSYIRGDPRFKGLNSQKRKVIYAWAQREFRNLMAARDAGVSAPKPIAVMQNILIMEFIGENNEAAPKLKDKPAKNAKKFGKEVIKQMKLLYKNDLVHGDLSEFNILNWNDKPVLIDLSHSVKLNYPGALELLRRDVVNVCNYFNRKGLKIDADRVFNEIVARR
jgi:RIO kinase 1